MTLCKVVGIPVGGARSGRASRGAWRFRHSQVVEMSIYAFGPTREQTPNDVLDVAQFPSARIAAEGRQAHLPSIQPIPSGFTVEDRRPHPNPMGLAHTPDRPGRNDANSKDLPARASLPPPPQHAEHRKPR